MEDDPFLERVRGAVKEVLEGSGAFDMIEMRAAFAECKGRLDEAILEMKRTQQNEEVWRALAAAYKKEIERLEAGCSE